MSTARMLVVFALCIALFGTVEAQTTVTSVKVTVPPSVDGKVDELWAKAGEVKLSVAGGELKGTVEVTMKSVYTDSDAYFLFQWKDADESLNRMYEFDGAKWSKVKGNEDRFNVMWNIDDSIAGFNTAGCAGLCHTASKQLIQETGEKQNLSAEAIAEVVPMGMWTNAANERGDLWHWKAHRTNPVAQVDDQYIGSTTKIDGEDITGRGSDKKESGGYSDNFDKAKARPKFAFKEKPTDVRILLKENAAEVTDATVFKAGDRVPREVVSKFVGSRGDIEAKGVWSAGMWTLEEKRALDTKNPDDIQFKDLGKSYSFAISVHDNGDGGEHGFQAGAAQLKFEVPKPPTPAPTPAPKGICGPSALLVLLLPALLYTRRNLNERAN